MIVAKAFIELLRNISPMVVVSVLYITFDMAIVVTNEIMLLFVPETLKMPISVISKIIGVIEQIMFIIAMLFKYKTKVILYFKYVMRFILYLELGVKNHFFYITLRVIECDIVLPNSRYGSWMFCLVRASRSLSLLLIY